MYFKITQLINVTMWQLKKKIIKFLNQLNQLNE